ncbi:MAG: alkaline phosphatase D family protein [Planctomycetota bacterium]|nr:alkaline phosphatase D family protein [Planctomycetota bacterium]
MTISIERRRFNAMLAKLSVGAYVATRSRSLFSDEITQDRLLPNITSGVASGDVTHNAATIWSRADRPSRMIVELSNNEAFKNVRRIVGPDAFEHSDFTAKLRLFGLKPGEPQFYRVRFQDLNDSSKISAPATGRFATPSTEPRDIKFTWSGDTAGQGYGIDLARGGMTTFETMRTHSPDFFVNSGDVCYADNPIASELKLDDGSIWKNVVIEGKAKVAESLEEYRSNYRYNLMDANVRRLNAEVPSFVQWDDHETLNNWYPGQQLQDDRYTVKSVSLLSARARQAFLDYLPIHATNDGMSRIYRTIPYGPLLEVFFIDLRSYRGANSPNRQTEMNDESAYMGKQQLQWLKAKLKASQATWKVICSDMPIGLLVRDGKADFENGANGDGPALGRELEIADLLSFIKANQIKNTVWLTADVHYAASHYYDPSKAVFQDFDPFWEFVSGPLHAGTFGPGEFDNTFGPQLKFKGIPDGMKGNRPPSDGFQFFGLVKIDAKTRAMTVTHYNTAGKNLWSIDLPPV